MTDEQGIDDAARLMLYKADHWYWAEREICGFAADTEPPCVKSHGHDGDCDGTYAAPAQERLTAWIDDQILRARAAALTATPNHGRNATT